jgi:purine-nucleoside phosphorylase
MPEINQELSAGAERIDSFLRELGLKRPSFHVVLGSGFKDSVNTGIPAPFKVKGEISFSKVPGLHPSTAPGHDGKYVIVENQNDQSTGVIQVGRLHGYEGLDPREVVRTVMYTRELGAHSYFITNAAGGIDTAHRPGDVMIMTDQINLTGKNPLVGENPKKPNGEEWGPRFPDVTRLFGSERNQQLKKAFQDQSLKVHEGVYIGVLGPVFETPAEIQFYIRGGAQAVGMSTVWETVALKHSGARVNALSLISNLGAGMERASDGSAIELDHFAILDACKNSSIGILKGILNVACSLK